MNVDGFPNEFDLLSSSDSENGKVSNNVTDDRSDNEDIVHRYWNMITCRNNAYALIESGVKTTNNPLHLVTQMTGYSNQTIYTQVNLTTRMP